MVLEFASVVVIVPVEVEVSEGVKTPEEELMLPIPALAEYV